MNTKQWLVTVDDNENIQDLKSRLMCAAPELLKIAEADEARVKELEGALRRIANTDAETLDFVEWAQTYAAALLNKKG